jgi:Predicted DNA-binding proteins
MLGLDEAEALRLADLEGLYQEAAARSMGVSRQTFGRIVESARGKVADAILNGKALKVEGGRIAIDAEGASIMKIAVPSREGLVDEHFGHCKEFLVFRVEGEALVEEGSVPSQEGCGCKSGVAAELARMGVTHLVAGNMGEGAVRVLGSHGIAVVRGASGDSRAAARDFLSGAIADSGAGCSGHGHECSH